MSGNRAVTRAAAVAAVLSAALTVTLAVGAVREKAGLPRAAEQFLQATIQASALTTCLQGSRDDLFMPGDPSHVHDPVAVAAALARLRTCSTEPLSAALDRVNLPPAAALTDRDRRRARADMVTGIALLRRVVLDADGARVDMERQIRGKADGTAVVLAYRSADSGSTTAYALAEEALALLGHPQSSVT